MLQFSPVRLFLSLSPVGFAAMVMGFVLFFSACRRDKDDVPPAVSITSPTGTLPTFGYAGFMYVSFTASDASGIDRWAIRLIDEQGNRRFSTDYFGVADGPGSITQNFTIFFEDIHWPSGEYTLSVFVVDVHGNEGAAFKQVRYNEAPLKRERVVVIRTPTSQTVAIDTLTASGTLAEASVFSGDHRSSAASSFHGELLQGGSSNGVLRFLDRSTMLETGSYSVPNPLGGDFFRDIALDPNRNTYFVSGFDGLVREFGKGGQIKSSFEAAPGFRPEHLVTTPNRIVATLRAIGGNGYLLASFFKNSGALEASVPIGIEVVKLLRYNGNVVVIGNKPDNTPALLLINMANFGVSELPWLISNQRVTTAVEIGNGFYAVAHHDGVWGYRLGTGQFFSGGGNGVNASSLAYDPVSNQLFATDNTNLYVLSGNNGALLNTVGSSGIRSVEVLMNK